MLAPHGLQHQSQHPPPANCRPSPPLPHTPYFSSLAAGQQSFCNSLQEPISRNPFRILRISAQCTRESSFRLRSQRVARLLAWATAVQLPCCEAPALTFRQHSTLPLLLEVDSCQCSVNILTNNTPLPSFVQRLTSFFGVSRVSPGHTI